MASRIKKKSKQRKEVNIKMELNLETEKTNGNGNGHLLTEKSRSIKTDSLTNGHISIFDPNKYMLKLPKTKKITLDNGMVKWEKPKPTICQLPPELLGSEKIIPTGALSQRLKNGGIKPLS
jgi:hypothetical protein